MARPLRLEYPGACYHVMNRGNRGQTVFGCEGDNLLFLEKLGQFAEGFRVQVRAYCLLGNHFHLYLCTPEANLSRFMQSLLTSFTVSHNRRHGERGHLFQGRFKAFLIEADAYGAQVSRYIHLNPGRVKALAEAGIEERRATVRDWRWSSYAAVIGLRECPAWLQRAAVLDAWGDTLAEQQRRYAEYVEQGLTSAEWDPFAAAAAQAVIGTDRFVDQMRRGLRAPSERAQVQRELGQATKLRAWVSLDELVAAVAKVYGVERQELLRPHSRDNEGRQVLLYLAGRCCRGRQTLSELAEQLGPVSVGALTRVRHVIEARLKGTAGLRRPLSAVERELGMG